VCAAIAEEICPDKKDTLCSVSMSASTITQRTEEMGADVHDQLQDKAKQFAFFSLALDESNDIKDTAQLLVFINVVDDSTFEVTEDLAALQSIKGSTTDKDILAKFGKQLKIWDLTGIN